MEKNNITFLEMVCAVVFGLMIFKWINELNANEGMVAILKPLFWVGITLYMIIGFIIDRWRAMKQEREWREADKKAAEQEKSKLEKQQL